LLHHRGSGELLAEVGQGCGGGAEWVAGRVAPACRLERGMQAGCGAEPVEILSEGGGVREVDDGEGFVEAGYGLVEDGQSWRGFAGLFRTLLRRPELPDQGRCWLMLSPRRDRLCPGVARPCRRWVP
jgi:hypothetical protein